MKLLKPVLLLSIMFFSASSVLAGGTWTTYTNPNKINDFSVYGDYLWCATTGGLLRIDIRDNSFSKYTTADGLPDNYVDSVFIDKKGVVWCYCQGLLGRYDGIAWQTFKLKSTQDYIFYELTISDNDEVWLVSSDSQIELLDGESTVVYNDELVDDFTSVKGIQVISKNNIWLISSQYGVAHCDGYSWTFYDGSSDLGTSIVYGIAQDSQGIIWVATDKGLASYNGSMWTTYYNNSPYCEFISIDEENVVWGGTSKDLWSFDKTTWKHHIHFEDHNYQIDILNNRVFIVVVDKENKKWIKTSSYAHGIGSPVVHDLNSFDNVSWENYTEWRFHDDPSYGYELLRKIIVFDDNTKWFQTSKGITQYDGNSWEKVTFDVTVDDYELYYRGTDNNNNTWFSYNGSKGLMCYDGTNKTLYPLEKRSLIDFYVDKNNTIWITTYDYDYFAGIASFDHEKWIQHIFGNEQKVVINIYGEDKLHRIWFGSPGTYSLSYNEYKNAGGMMSYDGTTFTRYTVDDGLPSNAVQTIAVDNDNTLWIGTDKGLTRYDGETWTTYTQRNGLADDIVHSIAIDHDGILWIGTECGLSRFDPDMVTFIDAEDSKPSQFNIVGNYPNPFNPATTIQYEIPFDAQVRLVVYDVLGREITVLQDGMMSDGVHSVVWNGKDSLGNKVSSGIYIYQLHAGDFTKTNKMMLLR